MPETETEIEAVYYRIDDYSDHISVTFSHKYGAIRAKFHIDDAKEFVDELQNAIKKVEGNVKDGDSSHDTL